MFKKSQQKATLLVQGKGLCRTVNNDTQWLIVYEPRRPVWLMALDCTDAF